MSKLVKFEAPELMEIEDSRANQIRETFEPMAEMLEGFEDKYKSLVEESKNGIDSDITAKAKRLRLDIRKVRTETDKLHKEVKHRYLIAGRAVDGVRNILKNAVYEREENLEKIEKHFENLERERIQKLQKERVEKLSKYVDDAEARDLGSMEEDVWNAYISAKKQAWEDEQEAIRKAEAKRKEREEKEIILNKRRESIWKLGDFFDYESLNLDTSEDEFEKMVLEAEKRKKDHEREQEKLRIEAENREKELQKERKEREAERKKREKQLEKERQKREEAERKEKERKEKERKEREEKEKAEREAAAAPVRKRVKSWVDSFELPQLLGDKNEASKDIQQKFESFKKWAKDRADQIK